MDRQQLLARLARSTPSRIVLLILDGLGDLRSTAQPKTALDAARLPNLDELARRSSLGLIDPIGRGITPGSGPAHLALFGYDPTHPSTDIGRGVLEALGLGLRLGAGEVAARGNFATADASGNLTDRRAGRPNNEECRRLSAKLQAAVDDREELSVTVHPGEGHRFVLLLRGSELSSAIADTDPQRLGVPPLELRATEAAANETVRRLEPLLRAMQEAIAEEPKANRVLLRGFSELPQLPSVDELYGLTSGAFAGYPLYRGVAAACGMAVVECGKGVGETVATAVEHWEEYDFFFLHIKQTDQAGEDGDLAKKVEVLEEVDRVLPELLARRPEVLAITGDHSTPAPMRAHSWHPVPLLISSERCFLDDTTEFSESVARTGSLGRFPSADLLGLLLAHAGKLGKFGA